MSTNETLYRKFIDVPSNDGKRHRITVSARSERELEIKYREKLIELAKNDFRFARTVTVRNFFPHYMEVYQRPNMRDAAYHDKHARLQTYFVSQLGDASIDSITASTLQKILNDNRDKSKSFLSKLKGEITAFFDAAEDEGMLQRNPCHRLFVPACTSGKRRALTPEERKAFLAAAKSHKNGLLFLTMYYCGLRPGEARALTYDDIDPNGRTIRINKAVESRTGKIKPPKTASGNRTVPIPDGLLPLLPTKKGKGYVFTGGHSGKPISNASYKRAWQAILNRMDIEMGAKTYRNKIIEKTSVVDRSLTPYYLRHTYCSILPEKNVDIKTAQYLMGHSSITVTADIYQHVTDQMFEAAASKIREI